MHMLIPLDILFKNYMVAPLSLGLALFPLLATDLHST